MKNSVIAQDNVPKVSCMYCSGTGRAGYTFCIFCGGSGLMTDPQYLNQQAYEYGKNLAKQTSLCMTGKTNLVNGNYSAAVDVFEEAMDLKNMEAVFFLGTCFELGMGVKIDKRLAKDFYSLGAKYGNIDSQQALNRINQYGYWTATEDMRQEFRKRLKMQLEIQSQAVKNELENSYQNNSSHTREETRNGYQCPVCHGTGKCYMCAGRGEKRYDDGTPYDCLSCHGSGQCSNCHGSGRIR